MGFSCIPVINYADNFGVVSDTEAGATDRKGHGLRWPSST